MFRQSSKILRQSLSFSRIGQRRFESNDSKDSMCKHHQELVPPFSEVGKLKSFELKSDCTTFHMKSSGYNPCSPPCPPCPQPCPPTKKPCPCPEENPYNF